MKLVLPLILATALLTACKTVTVPAPPTPTGGAIERATVRVSEADKIVVDLTPKSVDDIRAGLGWVHGMHVGALGDLRDASTSFILADAEWRDTWNKEHEQRLSIENNGWVKAAFFVRKWVYIIVGTYVALGVSAVVLGAFVPGWGIVASKMIVKFLPFANPFAWARDWIVAKRA